MAMQANPTKLALSQLPAPDAEIGQPTRNLLVKPEINSGQAKAPSSQNFQETLLEPHSALLSSEPQKNKEVREAPEKRKTALESFSEKSFSKAKADSSLASYPSIRPVKGGYISGYFGRRRDPFTGSKRHHSGVDIAVDAGASVLAAADGKVLLAKKRYTVDYGYGREVLIDHGGGVKTRYAHLSKIRVKKGQTVKKGEVIGLSGQTGRTTGPHLHYEVIVNNRPKSPTLFFQEPAASHAGAGRL